VFAPGQLDPANVPGVLNPIPAPAGWGAALAQVETIGNVLVTAAVVAASLSLVVRYRRADRVETAQIRWIALLGVLTAPAFAIGSLQIDVVSDIFFGIGLALFSMMPLAIGIAITRYRLYDIDRLINRTLVYGLLTAILAGVFTAGIGFAQRLFIATTGQSSDAAVVAATLVVATLYAPLRKRLENLVDRRFKYEQQRFGAYREQIAGVLTIIEPGRAAQRLVEEAVRELQATGGAILTSTGSETATSGRWPVAPIVRLPIPGGNARMATIVVGPRVDGQPHDPPTVAQLEEMASLVGAAVRLAGGVRTETGR
jgi:hypothetical protein